MTKRRKLMLVMLGLGALGALFIVSGLAPIRASSGHWFVTRALLQFTKERAVASQSFGIQAPNLDSERLVLIGAGHYEGGCRWCHGAPGQPLPPVMQAATPSPPDLQKIAAQYEAEELFFIVKHGIKFTGMPAWPSQARDDEVWAVVAFLQKLPSLNASGYRQLVYGAPPTKASESFVPELAREHCARCHGLYGRGRGRDAFPNLAGQTELYLRQSLVSFARGERASGIMQPLAAELSEQEMAGLAKWYAEQEPPSVKFEGPVLSQGRALALRGIPDRRIPACAGCHGPSEHAHHVSHPILAGQPEAYLRQQLELFARGVRGGSRYAPLMQHVSLHELEDDEVRAVASFYASQQPRK